MTLYKINTNTQRYISTVIEWGNVRIYFCWRIYALMIYVITGSGSGLMPKQRQVNI